jgi:hypothetical protein
VAALITTVLGAASPWRRAALLARRQEVLPGCGGAAPWWQPLRPDENAAVFVVGELFRLDQFNFHVFEVRVIEVEPTLERPVRDTPLTLEHLDDVGQELFKRHG